MWSRSILDNQESIIGIPERDMRRCVLGECIERTLIDESHPRRLVPPPESVVWRRHHYHSSDRDCRGPNLHFANGRNRNRSGGERREEARRRDSTDPGAARTPGDYTPGENVVVGITRGRRELNRSPDKQTR